MTDFLGLRFKAEMVNMYVCNVFCGVTPAKCTKISMVHGHGFVFLVEKTTKKDSVSFLLLGPLGESEEKMKLAGTCES